MEGKLTVFLILTGVCMGSVGGSSFCVSGTEACYKVGSTTGSWTQADNWCRDNSWQLAPSYLPDNIQDYLPGHQRFWLAYDSSVGMCTALNKYYRDGQTGLDKVAVTCQSYLLALCQVPEKGKVTTTTTTTTRKTSTTPKDSQGTSTTAYSNSTGPGDAPFSGEEESKLGMIIGVAVAGFILFGILIAVLVFLAFRCLKTSKSRDIEATPKPVWASATSQAVPPIQAVKPMTSSQRDSDIWPMATTQSEKGTVDQTEPEPKYEPAAPIIAATPSPPVIERESAIEPEPAPVPVSKPEPEPEPEPVPEPSPPPTTNPEPEHVYSSVDEVNTEDKRPLYTVDEDGSQAGASGKNASTGDTTSKPGTSGVKMREKPKPSYYSDTDSRVSSGVIEHDVFEIKDYMIF